MGECASVDSHPATPVYTTGRSSIANHALGIRRWQRDLPAGLRQM